MTPAPAYAPPTGESWFARTEAWLDARGRGAWIALAVAGLIAFWPLGLAVAAYAIWSKRMFSRRTSLKSFGPRMASRMAASRSTGNAAFDSYKSDMLRRLEEEQDAFETFLQRLRESKDKAEFDQFMADRSDRKDDRAEA